MDVVDTLRHQDNLVSRELSEEQRDAHLLKRLREIYLGQGIEVPDRILVEGVQALKEQRFVYTPPLRQASPARLRLPGSIVVASVAVCWRCWR
nr:MULTISPECIES: DUF6384 family protein [unclassified Bradyrhizobium]